MRLGRLVLRQGMTLLNPNTAGLGMVTRFPAGRIAAESGRRSLSDKTDEKVEEKKHNITFSIPQGYTTLSKRQDAFKISDRARDREAFIEVIERFKVGNPSHKGHVEFIEVALNHMEEFQVAEDLEIFKMLMDLFPKKKMIAQNLIQATFWHFPRHQDTGIQILEKMESGGVMPDREMRLLIMDTFGAESNVFKKFSRMMYWMPKFKNASPYPLPKPVPRDPRELARLAVERMTGVDLESEVVDLHADDVPDSIDKTWIVSGQSPKQRQLLAEEKGAVPLRIEGPHRIWLRDSLISYFVLVGEPREAPDIRIDTDDVSDLRLIYFGEKPDPSKDITRLPSVHEQIDATIFAICTTGTSSRDSLLSWLRLLQKTNPCLEWLPVVFKLKAPTNALTTVGRGSANESGFEKDCGTENRVEHSDAELWDEFQQALKQSTENATDDATTTERDGGGSSSSTKT